jgi:hypothetical protein
VFSSRKQGNKYVQKILFTPPNRKNQLDANISLFFVATLPQKGIPAFNKSQFGAKVRSIAKTFTMENTCELPPPLLEVKITRLYILLLETNIFTNKKQLEKPKKHYGVSNETGNKWYFNQHACFNIWSMVFLSTNEYFTTFVPYLVYHLL